MELSKIASCAFEALSVYRWELGQPGTIADQEKEGTHSDHIAKRELSTFSADFGKRIDALYCQVLDCRAPCCLDLSLKFAPLPIYFVNVQDYELLDFDGKRIERHLKLEGWSGRVLETLRDDGISARV